MEGKRVWAMAKKRCCTFRRCQKEFSHQSSSRPHHMLEVELRTTQLMQAGGSVGHEVRRLILAYRNESSTEVSKAPKADLPNQSTHFVKQLLAVNAALTCSEVMPL